MNEGEKNMKRIEIPITGGKTREQMLTELSLSTVGRNALSAQGFANSGFPGGADYQEASKIIAGMCGKVRAGNLDELTDMLTAQAITMDTMFTEYSRIAFSNIGHHPEAVERYSNLAARAQANCRTTVETLARVKRGGAQTVKVVHVHEGGQAVVADTINQGARGGVSGRKDEPPHEQAADAPLSALSGPDEARDGLPLSSLAGADALSAPRRKVARSEGQ